MDKDVATTHLAPQEMLGGLCQVQRDIKCFSISLSVARRQYFVFFRRSLFSGSFEAKKAGRLSQLGRFIPAFGDRLTSKNTQIHREEGETTMAEQMDKAELLNSMHTGYAVFETLLTPLSTEQMTRPGVNGEWSVKDILSHLTAWHRHLLHLIEVTKRSEEPSDIPDGLTTDQINDQFYQQNKHRPLGEVLDDFRSTYRQVDDWVNALSEEGLHKSPWPGSAPLWGYVAGNTYEHYEEHSRPIQEWLAR
jgi:hypothetical protein